MQVIHPNKKTAGATDGPIANNLEMNHANFGRARGNVGFGSI
jgi:hypothetical protein